MGVKVRERKGTYRYHYECIVYINRATNHDPPTQRR